jgi:hypothetical protein
MPFVATLDIPGLATDQYDAALKYMEVLTRPSPGMYLHICAPIEGGLRITELWDTEEGFRSFIEERLFPAAAALDLDGEPVITVEAMHFLFAPRAEEIAALVAAPS